jgi:hypothetical protein
MVDFFRATDPAFGAGALRRADFFSGIPLTATAASEVHSDIFFFFDT